MLQNIKSGHTINTIYRKEEEAEISCSIKVHSCTVPASRYCFERKAVQQRSDFVSLNFPAGNGGTVRFRWVSDLFGEFQQNRWTSEKKWRNQETEKNKVIKAEISNTWLPLELIHVGSIHINAFRLRCHILWASHLYCHLSNKHAFLFLKKTAFSGISAQIKAVGTIYEDFNKSNAIAFWGLELCNTYHTKVWHT